MNYYRIGVKIIVIFYLKKIIKKVSALVLWPVFTILSLVAKPMFFLLRIMSVPGIFVSGYGLYTTIFAEISVELIKYVAIGLVSIIMLFKAPRMARWVNRTKYRIKETALFPIVVKAKHKFTYDGNYE